MFFECFRGQLFENGKRYTNSETTMQKALEKRITNHILHVQFERKISVSQSNLLYWLYVYNDLKRQKMPKGVKIFTSKWHRKQQHFFTQPFLIILMHSVCREEFFCREQAHNTYQSLSYVTKGLGGGIFNYAPFWGPLEF